METRNSEEAILIHREFTDLPCVFVFISADSYVGVDSREVTFI